jgi:spermidine synthase
MASSKPLARRHQALLLATGAATLALELLASRVLTPYFGVSLYIWAGILSITLIFLALGYRMGGLVADLGEAALLEALALAAPLVAAIAIGLACAVYPVVFPALAGPNLVAGSFIASAVLLAGPLVTLAAVNPLVIGLWRHAGPDGGGGRAGRVLFLSTVGSVAGVLLTAFLFIPLLTNYRALLLVGVALTAGAALATWRSPVVSRPWKRRLFGLAAVATALLATLLVGQRRYVDLLAGLGDGTIAAAIRAEYTSVFGNVKVVDFTPRGRATPVIRALLQDGLIQNRTTLEGVSLSPYTYVLEALARAARPGGGDALVLGLGAGVVPRGLRRAGFGVTVVEINADALRAAGEFFGFGAVDVPVHVTDARTFVRGCRAAYDVAVVDLFQGDSTPEYLLTLEFFRDLRRCLRPGGTVAMNAFFDNTDETPNRRLLATVGAAFPTLFEFRSGANSHEVVSNGFVVATLAAAAPSLLPSAPAMPDGVSETVRRTLASGRQARPEELAGTPPVTDEGNVFGVLHAPAQLMFRAHASRVLPPHVLLN